MILRFPDERQTDLVLSQGVHAIGRDPEGLPGPVADAPAALAQFCIDRRGAWLRLRDGAQGVHVNGRPVRRMAMLRGGDSVYLDGVELQLLGREPAPAPSGAGATTADGHVVLRGVGGTNHGRSFVLEGTLGIVSPADGELRIGRLGSGGCLARLERHEQGAALHVEGELVCHVNGWPVRDALLRPCDQLVLDARHRFVVEAPMCESAGRIAAVPDEDFGSGDGPAAREPATMRASARRLPWLLLAALLLSGALALLLLYGAR